MGNRMNLHDSITELYRLVTSGSIKEKSPLESSAKDFQDLLFEYNRGYGEKEFEETGGVVPANAFFYNPFTVAELDAIRHYYGQKLALETEGPLEALAVPLGHELFEKTGLFSPHWEESLYDVYINAKSALDYYSDEGLPARPFYDKLRRGQITKDEFIHFGKDRKSVV